MRSIRAHAFPATLLLSLVAAGCGGGATEPASSARAGADEPTPAAGGPEERPAAPDFALEALDGREVRLADSEGSIRLIDFWATWCAPCREEIPMLNELQASYADRGFQILAISEEEREIVREFVDRHGVNYLNLVGTAEVAEAYGVLGLPAAYLVDRSGRVVETFLGPKPRRVLVEKIEALIAAAPST